MTATISVVATGGTIANTADGRKPIGKLLSQLGKADALPVGYRVKAKDLVQLGGDEIGPDVWLNLTSEVQHQVERADVAGVVVTHGTYTAEETAFFLHLALRTNKPVVLTCAQRKFGSLGSDSLRNLADALLVAASPEAGARGVLVVVNETIHSARDVTKTSQRLWGFQSGEAGLIGTVDGDKIRFMRGAYRNHTLTSNVIAAKPLPRVDIIAAYPGADGAGVRAHVEAGARGLVVSGYSYRGWPAPGQVAALVDAQASGVPVVLASRGGLGRVPAEDDRFITGDSLTPQKARILLMLALATPRAGQDRSALQEIFDSH